MKYILTFCLIIVLFINVYSQNYEASKFSLNVNVDKSFLSYGDIWGIERAIELQYGHSFFIGIKYGFSNFEGAEFTEDYYKKLSNSTLVDKYLNSIFGNQEVKFFGYKSLSIKDNLINIDSYQLKIGGQLNLFSPRFQVGFFGSFGLLKLSRIATDFTISGIDIQNPSVKIDDVTIFGTFTHRFIDFSYGFGTEFNYEILKDRLKIGVKCTSSLSSVRWFTIGAGIKVNI